MTNSILDRAYRVEESAGVAAHRVVVAGIASGSCLLPDAANAGRILGITTHAQPREDAAVGVRKAGVALVQTSAAVAVGDPVVVADTQGRVAPAEADGGLANVVGFAETAASGADELIEVFLSIHAAYFTV